MRPPARDGARREALWLAVALFAWFACTAWLRPLALPDEGRYAGVAWEMVASGQWAVPTLDGLPFFHKPPLFYWIAAGAMWLAGPVEWAARMPSLLGATLGAWSLYLFSARWSGRPQARRAALVLATQPFFCLGAQFANLDMLVAGCISATVLLGAHALGLAAQGRPHRAVLVAAYGAAALGVLAKGLIGAVLPAAVFVAWLLVARQPRALGRLVSLPGLLLFGLVALPWFVAMQHRHGGFYAYFIVHHHLQRFAQGGFNNPQPPWFYLPVVLLFALPWTLALPAALRQRGAAPPGGPPSIAALRGCWLAVVLLFFSLPQSKLVGYVLPALPPLAWLLARALERGAPGASRLARHTALLAGAAALLCVAVAAGVAWAGLPSHRPLGLALRAQHRAGEPVILVRRYAYDLPFYARLAEPLQVLDDWRNPVMTQHDDWRRELVEAGRFAPALARQRLIDRGALPALLCGHARSWIVATAAQLQAEPQLAGAREVARTRDVALWLLPRSALNCGTPNDAPAGR